LAKRLEIIKKKAPVIQVLVGSSKIIANVKLTTEKKIIEIEPKAKAHKIRLKASDDSKKLSPSIYTMRSPRPKME
jgi:hypothetical protein